MKTALLTFILLFSSAGYGREQGVAQELSPYFTIIEKMALTPLYDHEFEGDELEEYKRFGIKDANDFLRKSFLPEAKKHNTYIFVSKKEVLWQYIQDFLTAIRKRVASIEVPDLKKQEDATTGWVIQLHQLYRALLKFEASPKGKAKLLNTSFKILQANEEKIDSERDKNGNPSIQIHFDENNFDDYIKTAGHAYEDWDKQKGGSIRQWINSFAFGVDKKGVAKVAIRSDDWTIDFDLDIKKYWFIQNMASRRASIESAELLMAAQILDTLEGDLK